MLFQGYLCYQETSKLPETSCKNSHARRARAFTVKGVAISRTPLSPNQWIPLASYFYLIFHLLLPCSGMLWDALLVFAERTATTSQGGRYLVTKPAFLLQLPGCQGVWLTARQAAFAFQCPRAQLAHGCGREGSLLQLLLATEHLIGLFTIPHKVLTAVMYFIVLPNENQGSGLGGQGSGLGGPLLLQSVWCRYRC